jgi:hypothetical protein
MIKIRSRKWRYLLIGAAFFGALSASAQNNLDPEVARLMERALQDAENFRQQLRTSEYEAKMLVKEWDGSGRLRGTAKATAIVRPGGDRPMTFVSRDVQGKVHFLSERQREKNKDDEDKSTLLDFAREHKISDRYDFVVEGKEQVAGDNAVRVRFSPTKRQPEKNRADRFLDTITGTAWVSEARNRLVKFEMRLMQPFRIFWILATLDECTIQYELLEPGEILGRAKLKVLFELNTPIYTIRQEHDVELDHFRRRDPMVTAAR